MSAASAHPASAEVAVLEGVRKQFGDVVALREVDLRVGTGESVGLLGPNGAGKTTLIGLLTGLRRADAGTVRLFGGSPHDPVCRARLGVTPQATAVPVTLRVHEAVEFVAAHYPHPLPTGELLERFGLAGQARLQCGGLSGGQQRRLLVALALVGQPQLLVLDEPTTGLDVHGRDTLWEGLRDYRAAGGTLLVTSHYLGEIEELATRVVVIDHGAVIADDTLDAIRGRVQLCRLNMHTSAATGELEQLPGVVAVERGDPDAESVVVGTRDADAAVRELVLRGIPFRDLRVEGATLEQAFLALTGPGADARPGS